MAVLTNINTMGEHVLSFTGAVGQVEGILTAPAQAHTHYIALLGHPHSLQGGSMNNKVVTTMARTFRDLGIPSLRFNFRGVGQSEGVYDAGRGESEDMLVLMNRCLAEKPDARFLFAGFSFGSYVAYRAASQAQHDLLISIAPAVHHYDYQEFTPPPSPWFIIQGDEDEVVPAELVWQFANQVYPPVPVIRFAETGHFFHGKLLDLKARLTEEITARVLTP